MREAGLQEGTFEELEQLPGVGHKTASVIMAQAFGVPAFPVDTHVHRVCNRIGLTEAKTAEKTAQQLEERIHGGDD